VLVTTSTDYQADEQLARVAVEALRDEPLRVILTLADADDTAEVARAGNVRVERLTGRCSSTPLRSSATVAWGSCRRRAHRRPRPRRGCGRPAAGRDSPTPSRSSRRVTRVRGWSCMPRNLTVVLHDKPGELARIGETLGDAGVDLRGLAAFTGEGNGIIQLLIEDGEAERATKALHDARIGLADDREVLVVDIHDRPGTLGEMAQELAAANVNIELAYSTFGGARLVIATDDLDNARAALA
jgi:hypothetical protein